MASIVDLGAHVPQKRQDLGRNHPVRPIRPVSVRQVRATVRPITRLVSCPDVVHPLVDTDENARVPFATIFYVVVRIVVLRQYTSAPVQIPESRSGFGRWNIKLV